MKVRFIIKEQEETVPEPAAVKTDDQLVSSIQGMLPNLEGAQLAALEKYAMALNSASLEEKKKEDPVSKKIKMLRDEGKPQKQAVAIALDMKERGKLKEKK